jgi:hypothetical protein
MRRCLLGTAVAVVLALALGQTAPARADGENGSGFQSMSLTAVAGGQRILADTIAGQPPGTIDSGIPDAEASMTSTTGHGLASVAWPSALVGNAGSLLLLLGPYPCTPSALFDALGLPITTICSPQGVPQPVMDQYHYLNTPLRAEAQYPTKPAADTNLPGATMTARATAAEVSADAILGAVLASDIETASSARATSIVKATGPTSAVADATSTITNITLAGGEVTIGSVVSTAHGETNGVLAKSSGTTTVNDMKIHGVAVTVDDKGLQPATDGVNQVITNFGMKMFVTRPTQKVSGAATSFDAGSLIIEWFPPGAPGGVVFEFGGAHITAASTLPFDAAGVDAVVSELPPSSFGGLDLSPVGSSGLGTDVVSPLAPAQSGSPSLPLAPATDASNLPGGVSPWLLFLGLVAAAALAGGLVRIPARVLDSPAARCESGESDG